uniref:Golgin subfamily A member 7 n=1 Tax=Sinocyclocheilus rhinocerous TaxID=307959 RepID=A0A673L604_9TELE
MTHSLQDLRQAAVTSKVFVQRDYTSGTICKFQTKFPAELESRIDKQQFEETIQTLNNLYAEAEKLGGRSYLEGCLACLTAYTIFLCMETHYEKVIIPFENCPEYRSIGSAVGVVEIKVSPVTAVHKAAVCSKKHCFIRHYMQD